MTPDLLGQTVINGLLIGFVFALCAVGLSLIWGMVEIVNFAHGEFLMVGMYVAFWMYTLFAIDPLVSLPVATLTLAVFGVATHQLIIRRVLRAPMLAQIIATFGLSIFLRAVAQFLFTPNFRVIEHSSVSDGRIALGGLYIGLPQLVAALGALVGFAFIYWTVEKTTIGRAMMATAEDREAASLMGIDQNKMWSLAWGIGAGAVGMAGGLLSTFYYIQPEVGQIFGLVSFIVVALGGFGSIPGAFIAGLIVGLVQVFAGFFIAPELKWAVVASIYLFVVLLRPQGLFGKF